jgi:hypothetical protein
LSISSKRVSLLSPVSESRCATTTKGTISEPKASSKAGLWVVSKISILRLLPISFNIFTSNAAREGCKPLSISSMTI